MRCIFISPSSELSSASPLKGEAVAYVNLTFSTASPLRGEAGWKSDEGGKNFNNKKSSRFLPLYKKRVRMSLTSALSIHSIVKRQCLRA